MDFAQPVKLLLQVVLYALPMGPHALSVKPDTIFTITVARSVVQTAQNVQLILMSHQDKFA